MSHPTPQDWAQNDFVRCEFYVVNVRGIDVGLYRQTGGAGPESAWLRDLENLGLHWHALTGVLQEESEAQCPVLHSTGGKWDRMV